LITTNNITLHCVPSGVNWRRTSSSVSYT